MPTPGRTQWASFDPAASRDFFASVLDSPDLTEEADAVIAECGGLPLALDAAARMVRSYGWADTQNAFLRAHLSEIDTKWLPDSEQRNLAVVLAASVQALPERELACLLECAVWPEDVAVPAEALGLFWSAHMPDPFQQRKTANAFVSASLLQRDSNGAVRLHDLYHDYLRYLAGEDLAVMHGAIADRCVRFTETGCELIDNAFWALAHLPWHLLQAGRPEKAKLLQFDYGWLAAKLGVCGVQTLIADTRLVQDADLQRLGRVLRLSAHILAHDRTQLSAQLLGRFHDPPAGPIAELLSHASCHLPVTALIPNGAMHLTAPGQLVATFQGHGNSVEGALLLPDGRRALSWSEDCTLRLWDLESGESRPLQGHAGLVKGALLLDGGRALSWSDDRTLRLWDLESGEGRVLQSGSVRRVLLRDGGRALSWSGDRTLRLWDLESGEGRLLQGHEGPIRGALVLPDGGRALTWSGGCTLRLWDLENGEGRLLQGHEGRVSDVRLLPDGRRALSWSSDHTLRLWDLESGESQPLQGHEGPIRARWCCLTAPAPYPGRSMPPCGSGILRAARAGPCRATKAGSAIFGCCLTDVVSSPGRTITPCGCGTWRAARACSCRATKAQSGAR